MAIRTESFSFASSQSFSCEPSIPSLDQAVDPLSEWEERITSYQGVLDQLRGWAPRCPVVLQDRESRVIDLFRNLNTDCEKLRASSGRMRVIFLRLQDLFRSTSSLGEHLQIALPVQHDVRRILTSGSQVADSSAVVAALFNNTVSGRGASSFEV